MSMETHVYSPSGYCIGQVRAIGGRKWRTVTGKCDDRRVAFSRAAKLMRDHDKRVRVLWCTNDGYLEPALLMEGRVV